MTTPLHQALELLQRYERMRDAQRSYFRSRSQGALIRSKELENHLDRDVGLFLKEHKDSEQPEQQKELFQ